METVIEKKIYTEQERTEFKTKRDEYKKTIKELSAAQHADKLALRQPHDKLPARVTWKNSQGEEYKESGIYLAGWLMSGVLCRAAKISNTLIEYKKFLGKPHHMHVKK